MLLVVLFHCGLRTFSGGFIGVDVFFVLSGYLITGLLVAEVQKKSRISLIGFYARRVRRLLPASALVLIVTLIAAGAIMTPNEIQFASRAARATSLYLSNMFFASNASDYFAPGVETNPMLHTWSLGVEEQFYFFWPILIILGLQVCKSRKVLIGLLSGVTVISFGACVWLTANYGTFAFYGLPARAWEFGSGGLAALVPGGALRVPGGIWRGIQWFGLLMVLAAAVFIGSSTGFPGWVAALPCIGTIAALMAGAEEPNSSAKVLLNSVPLQFFGRMSYSWYLWHWPFLVFAAVVFPAVNWWGKLASAAAALGAAAISYHIVENPIRFHPYLMKRPVLTLSCAAAVTLASFTAATAFIRIGTRLSETPEMKKITAAAADIADMQRNQCVTLGDSASVKPCVYGGPMAAKSVVLFGDSHAIQWFDAVKTLAVGRGWKLTTILKSGCPPIDVRPREMDARFDQNCSEWRRESIRDIVSLHPALVIIGNSHTFLGEGKPGTGVSLDEWREGTQRTLRAFTGSGLSVAFLRDVPRPPFDIPTCLARSVRHSWYPSGMCDFDATTALAEAASNAEKQAARGMAGVKFVDLDDQICRGERCRAVQDGIIVYRDDNHLTGAFAKHLAPVLGSRLPVFQPGGPQGKYQASVPAQYSGGPGVTNTETHHH